MWNKLTIQQAQEIDRIRLSGGSNMDVEVELLATVLNKSIDEIDSYSWEYYCELRKKLNFLETQPSSDPIQFVNIGKKRYRFIFDIRQMPFARYIEGKTFAANFLTNLHKIAGSMCIPQKKSFFGWKDDKYDASKHEEYSTDMLQAPFEAVYASAVFFYHLYRHWIAASKDFLIKEQVNKGMTIEEAEKLVKDLCGYLDGIIPLKPLPNIKGLA